MSAPHSLPSAQSPSRIAFSDSIRYWELRRIPYNFVLAVVVVAWIVLSWPHFRPAFHWRSLLALFVLAVIANLCYCAAYIADVPVQFSSFRDLWHRRRWILWLVGMVFAFVVANYWIADEIYPYVYSVH